MRANQLIKGLSRNINDLNGLPNNVTALFLRFMSAKKSEMNGLAPCQFFDFGTVSEKILLEEFESAFEAYLEGFLRLPAPLCVFEYHQQGVSMPRRPEIDPNVEADIVFFYATPQGFNQLMETLAEDYSESQFEKIDFAASNTSDDRSIIGTYLLYYDKMPKADKPGVSYAASGLGKGWGFAGGFNQINFEKSKATRSRAGSFIKVIESFDGDIDSLSNVIFAPLFVFLARLHARGVERQIIHAPKQLNKRRIKKGVTPYVSYTKVFVNPHHETLGHSGLRDDNEYKPKRYHFRRGHVRHFQNGQKTWVRPCFVGALELGRVEHTYRVSEEVARLQ